MSTTLSRLLDSVFSGTKFVPQHTGIEENEIFEVLARLPFSLSKSQRTAIFRALRNDVSYIQGPPGTGKSFTISALAIAASELGLKVLVASQKTPAVDIVHKKLTDVLGESSCLYISDNQKKKENMRAIIDSLIDKSIDVQNPIEEKELNRLSAKVKLLVDERLEYAKKIRLFESELRNFYDLNRNAQDYKNILIQDWGLSKSTIKSINLIHNQASIKKAKELVNKCELIREKSRKNAGKLSFKDAMRLKILSSTVLKEFDFKLEEYKKHKEEVLIRSIDYSKNLADSQNLKRIIKDQPLESNRKTFNRRNMQLYPSNIKNSILSEYLSIRNSFKTNQLLLQRKYRETLDAFKRRLRWKNAKRAKKANSEIDFNLLFNVFQVIMGEIKSLHPYLPFQEELFDLVILDEASQVNLAEIFPILFRAKRYCIVGDHNQLGIKAGGVIFVSKVFEKFTWQKYFSSLPKYPIDYKSAEERDLLVSRSSILNLIRNDENPVSATPVQLNEHFRSLPMLAEFTSDQFYKNETSDSGLRIMTALPDKKAINAFQNVEVQTKREKNSQINKGEVDRAFKIIASIIAEKPNQDTNQVFEIPDLKNGKISVGVVCFIRDQVNYMKDEAEKRFDDDQRAKISLMIGTPEEFQGNERDVMIFTPAIDENQKRSRAFMEDSNRFNVATSRSKYFTYFVHGKIPSNMNLMEKMLTKMGQGKSEIQQMDAGFLPIGWTFKRSACDSDFEEVVADVLEKQIADEFPERLVLYNQVKTCGYRLDFVIYDKLSKKAVGIEVDGKHHYLADDSSYTDEHLERANSLKRAGWIIKYLPYWNWFEDGWIEDDAAAANDLREFIRRFFAIENEEEFNVRNANDQKLIDQDKKDLSSEETNFLSIPLYSSERTGRERKKPLPKEFLKEWNKEIQDSGALNPKKELD